jgi:hypothetical protein
MLDTGREHHGHHGTCRPLLLDTALLHYDVSGKGADADVLAVIDLRDMEDKIIPADKKRRAVALVTAVLLTVLGLLALGMLHAYLGEVKKLAEEDLLAAEQKMLRLVKIVLWVGGLSLVGMGGWFWRLGRRINLAGCFPVPGMKVVRNTRLRTGGKARALANLAQAVALLCVVAGTVGMWYVYRLAAAVLRQ